jgi:hypothetical protein
MKFKQILSIALAVALSLSFFAFASPQEAKAAAGDAGEFIVEQVAHAPVLVTGATLSVKITAKAPTGYNFAALALVAVWNDDQLEYLSTSNKVPASGSDDLVVFTDGRGFPFGTKTQLGSILYGAPTTVYSEYTIQLNFKVKQGFIDNGYEADFFVGPILDIFSSTGMSENVNLLEGGAITGIAGGNGVDWALCGATGADNNPYGNIWGSPIGIPFADIIGISPTTALNINGTGLLNNLVKVEYEASNGGLGLPDISNLSGMPSPLIEEDVFFSGYTTASAPTWTSNNPNNWIFDGWLLADGDVDGAITGTTVFDADEAIGDILSNEITLVAQWRAKVYTIDLGLPDIVVIHQKILQSTHSATTITETFTAGEQNLIPNSNSFSYTPSGTIDGSSVTYSLGDVTITWEDIAGFELVGSGEQDTLMVSGFSVTGRLSGVARVTVTLNADTNVSDSVVVEIPGDVNKDGSINNLDTSAVKKYVATPLTPDTSGFLAWDDDYSLILANINRDKNANGTQRINNNDTAALSNYVASPLTRNTANWL